ncbi:MAG: hypothetical protein QOJ38_1635 [Solirubrobacterales bacterium]|jgi:hypothetical protein|nr:hypothetical protein [Solirubrobacterales bacterium]
MTADQRALLQLLLERGQSYDDIGSLLGLSTTEVRARARAVLTEMAGEDPDAEVGLTDYLLGQADPIGRADAARHLQNDPGALELARGLVTQLQLLAPEAQLPELPRGRAARAQKPARAAAGTPARAGRDGAGSSASTGDGRRFGRLSGIVADRQSRIIAALVASTVLVIAVVLALSGVFDGGGGSGKGAAKSSKNVDEVPITLTAPGGGKAVGRAVFTSTGGRTGQIAFRIVGQGLKPSPKDNSATYTVWLYVDPKDAYPLAPVAVGADGKLSATRPIPAIFTTTQTGLQVLARFQTVRLSLTPTKELSALVTAAVKKQQPLLPYVGQTVLEGPIPGRVGASSAAAQGGAGAGAGAQAPTATTP